MLLNSLQGFEVYKMTKNYFELIDDNIFQFETVKQFFEDRNDIYILGTVEEIRNNMLQPVTDYKEVKKYVQSLSIKPNLYGLYVRENPGGKWKLHYIGQRKSGQMTSRLREHLYKKDKRTGSKLHKIEEAHKKNVQIGIKLFQVVPDQLRHYYEERLIQNFELEWNNHKHKINKL